MMKLISNKEKGYYWVTYVCSNCKTSLDVKVDFGKSIPFYSNDKNSVEKGWATQAPECEYCGCDHWSNGKKR